MTFCNIGAPGVDTGRRWGRPSPVKLAKNGREKRERKKKGKERKEGRKKKEKRERKKKKERENLSTPHRLRK